MKHAYIGRDANGCIMEAIVGTEDDDYVASVVAALQMRGLQVEQLPLDDANRQLRYCFGACPRQKCGQ